MVEKRVLIISPHFPPANAADMHRVRAILPHMRMFGWKPSILAVAPTTVHVPTDAWLAEGIPNDIPVHWVEPLSLAWTRVPGLGTLGFRAMGAMRRKGMALLKHKSFELVYFSTTAFELHTLGPHWKRKTGTPFVMDYQDPWVSDYYRTHPKIIPPGGRLKFAVVDRIHRYQEPKVLRACLGITSVSPAYPTQLSDRYPWLMDLPALILPFPGVGLDFERIRDCSLKQNIFKSDQGIRHWVYVGRGGDDMAKALSGFFRALSDWKISDSEEFSKTRLHFIGTSYAPSGRGKKTVLPIAERFGVEEIVNESTDRINYSTMLRCLLDADALIVPGSDDPAYTASKLYPYLLARKPLLTIFNKSSSVVDVLSDVGGAKLATFDESTSVDQLRDRITRVWFVQRQYEKLQSLDSTKFEPYTDIGNARQLCQFFDTLLPHAQATIESRLS